MKLYPYPLFSLVRNGATEMTLFGEVCVSSGQFTESFGRYPARSVLKPFQLFATGMTETVDEKDRERLAAACGSTSATESQVKILQEWHGKNALLHLKRVGKLPVSYPMDDTARGVLKAKNQPPELVYHSCLSKHSAMIHAALKNGWPIESYTELSHPYHLHLQKLLQEWTGRKIEQWVTDGCQLPSPVLSLGEIASLYSRLVTEPEFETIQNLMLDFPEWVGGPGRFDTKLMQANPKRIIAKEGADGLLAVAILPEGVGVVVKLHSGYQPALLALALNPVFKAYGIKEVAEVPKGQTIEFHYSFEKREAWIDISPEITKDIGVWPGDVGFERNISLDVKKGNHLTLSSINTTLHVGAHTDAPCHFEKGFGISEVDVSKYIGPVQIIEVMTKQNKEILASDIAGIEIRARRVLFKTATFEVNKFNQDFSALSPELIAYLGRKGVCLVGIDTPSIDLFASKELLTHHETLKWKMGILEGVDLKGVSSGIYELLAVPLKIQGADASPVRALIRGPISN